MTDTAKQARVRVRVRGRVQGVGFRFSAMDEAHRRQLAGWVRNCRDGSVEIVAEGDTQALQQFITWCRSGPPGALVVDVEQQWLSYTGEFDGFRIEH